MPKIDEWCEVRTTQGIFRKWTSVAVRYSIETAWARDFQLELAEAKTRDGPPPSLLNPGAAGFAIQQRLKPGDRVDIALAGQLVIKDGYIVSRQAAYDANRHAVQVVGSSKSWPIDRVSVDIPGQQFQKYPLSAIANLILRPIGVPFRLVNPPEIAKLSFRNVIVQPGETIGEMLMRLARQRACWLWVDVDGTIMGGNPSGNAAGDALEEGRNIVAASSVITLPQADHIVGNSQASGSDDLWGRDASEISAKSSLPGAILGTKQIILAEEPSTKQELQARVDHEVNALMAATHRDVITHKGWFRPGTSRLWELGESVTVKSPMLYPFNGGVMTMKVWGVTCSQDDGGGTRTQVELVNEATFGQRFPNAKEPDGYKQAAQLAVPENYA